jgi:thiamine pyrophosphokinase
LTKYKTISIVGSGEDYSIPKITFYAGKSDFIIACDGGLDILDAIGKKPDIIMGDLDSVNPAILEKYAHIETIKYPREKDLTDSEITLKKALSYEPEEIFLFAVIGRYFDHSLANIFNLFRNYSSKSKIKIITFNSEIFAVNKNYSFENLKGRRISFLPFGNISGLKMKGFKYQFETDQISLLDYSVSNVISENYAEININSGMLACILFDEGFR